MKLNDLEKIRTIMGANIQRERKKAGYKTQREIAQKMNISLPTYRIYETKPDKKSFGELMKLAEIFGCETTAFFAEI